MKPRLEDLDETIDRVAASLMTVPANSLLAQHITARIAQQRRVPPVWRFAAVGAALALVAVSALLWNRPSSAPDQTGARRFSTPEVGRPAAPARTPVETIVTIDADQSATRDMSRASSRTITHTPVVAQIASLPSPELLAVDELTTAPLTIAPVDLAPLDLANLADAESDERDVPKE